jgi:outer membrane protein assembly factor BamC
MMIMQFFHSLWRAAILVVALAALAACSTRFDSILPDRRPDYRQSTLTQTLEVPPDLTSSTIDDTLMVPEIDPSGSASLSTYAGERGGGAGTPVRTAQAVLPPQPGITVGQDGDRRWLAVAAPPEQVWPRVREFWTSNGFNLKREDPTIGVMETDWMENRADIPEDGIRRVLKRFLDVAYSAPTRDRFRVRLERGPDERSTEVYLSHSGVEEVAVGGTSASATNTFIWQRRPPSPELEAEMLNRLMVFLGASERRAETQLARAEAPATGPRSRLVEQGGEIRLIVDEEYSRAWRLVGLALDGSNYAVDEQSRGQGLYVVEYRDPLLENQQPGEGGFFSRLAFWRDESKAPPPGTRYRVRLAGQGEQTVVVVRDADDRPVDSATARQVLEAVQQVIQ